MQKATDMLAKFSKMNSDRLLKKVSSGKLKKTELKVVSKIIEKRFPTPLRKVA